jgi:hypothetical protein
MRAAIFIVLLTVCASHAADPSVIAIRTKWEDYRQKLRNYRLVIKSVSTTNDTDDGTSRGYDNEIRVAALNDCFSVDVQGSGVKTVFAANYQYSFELQDTGLGWVIKKKSTDELDSEKSLKLARSSIEALNISPALVSLTNYDFMDQMQWIDTGKMKLRLDGELRVLANDSYVSDIVGLEIALTSGPFSLPERIRYSIRTKRVADSSVTNTISYDVEYRYLSVNQLPVVQTVKSTIKTAVQGRTTTATDESTYTFDFADRPRIEDFRLSHYGLSEPPGIVWSKPTPLFVYGLYAAGGFFAVGLILHFIRKRIQSSR